MQMKKMCAVLCIALLGLLVTGCNTIQGGLRKELHTVTHPSGAEATLYRVDKHGRKEMVQKIRTPGWFTEMRPRGEYAVDIRLDGYVPLVGIPIVSVKGKWDYGDLANLAATAISPVIGGIGGVTDLALGSNREFGKDGEEVFILQKIEQPQFIVSYVQTPPPQLPPNVTPPQAAPSPPYRTPKAIPQGRPVTHVELPNGRPPPDIGANQGNSGTRP
jgi:hypothetical protein